jgi:AcrR family transcriptional regulator
MPRPYRLGRRAVHKEATRAQIIQAAIELYRERGISATSMLQVARRADVAPGTVLNHFPTSDDLAGAVVGQALAEIAVPEPRIVEGLPTIRERVLRLAREVGAFFERSEPWYRMWQRDPVLTGAWGEANAAYGTRQAELFRAALGPLAADDEAMTMLSAVVHPVTFGSIRARGFSTDAAAVLIAEAVSPWLEAKHASGGARGD